MKPEYIYNQYTCLECCMIFLMVNTTTHQVICPRCGEVLWEEEPKDLLSKEQEDAAIKYNKKQGYSPETWKEIQTTVDCEPDGMVGPDTVQHIATYQSNNQLGVDGKAGPATLDHMGITPSYAGDEYDIRNMIAAYPHLCFGIDISDWQGEVDAELIADAGVRFCILKATEGRTWQSEHFERNLQSLKASGVKVSAYHFTRMTDSAVTTVMDAKGGAKNFYVFTESITETRSCRFDFQPWNDLEHKQVSQMVDLTSDREAKEWLDRWLSEYENLTGGDSMGIYGSQRSLNLFGDHTGDLPQRAAWLVDYNKETWGGAPKMPDSWTEWRFRQMTSAGKVPGIHGDCDINCFNGDYSKFLDFCY